MARQSDDSDDLETPDDFEAMLRAVARPPEVGDSVLAQVALPSTLDMPESQLPFARNIAQEPAPGDLLDERYRLDRILGRGGMGVVYAARNLRTGKMVAIKWMSVGRRHSAAATTTMAERFRREARAAASIRHPNVVDVYDVGGPDDAPFLVMELLEGEALSERIRRATLPFDEAARVLLGVMRGVSAAHRAGIVHRDLKPDNVFLCSQPDGGASVAKVLDFGVAAIRDDSADGLASLTRSGAIIGTPAYMSPEQLTGRAVDIRTDIYALGVMLFEALTGRLPFEARNAGELAVKQATAAPTRLSSLRPELFGACERLVARALARDAEDRFANVEEFARTLEEVLARPEAATSHPKKPGRSLWWMLALLLMLSTIYVYAQQWAPMAGRAAQAPEPVTAQRAPNDLATPAPTKPADDASAANAAVTKPEPPPSTTRMASQAEEQRTVPPPARRARAAQGSRTVNPAAPTPSSASQDKTRLSYDDF